MRPETVSTKLHRLAEQARRHPERVFTTLHHLIDVEFLHEAFLRLRKNAASGVGGRQHDSSRVRGGFGSEID